MLRLFFTMKRRMFVMPYKIFAFICIVTTHTWIGIKGYETQSLSGIENNGLFQFLFRKTTTKDYILSMKDPVKKN